MEPGTIWLIRLISLISDLSSLPLTEVNGIVDKINGFSPNIRLNNSAKARNRPFNSPLTEVNGNE